MEGLKNTRTAGCGSRFLLAMFTIFVSLSAVAEPIAVFVPGFFNSLAEGYSREQKDGREIRPYYSLQAIESFEKRGFRAEVVDDLLPFGNIRDNGDVLARALDRIHLKYPGQPMYLIAHSAGGLYAWRALNLRPDLPVKAVVTLATPYRGVDLVDHFDQSVPGLRHLVQFVGLRSLVELGRVPVAEFTRSEPFPKGVRWIALSSSEEPCFLIDCHRPEKLSWPLSVAANMVNGPSDGIVTVSSQEGPAEQNVEHWGDFNLGLEHWEMTQDYRIFALLGVTNRVWIRDQQIRIFDEIARRLTLPASLNEKRAVAPVPASSRLSAAKLKSPRAESVGSISRNGFDFYFRLESSGKLPILVILPGANVDQSEYSAIASRVAEGGYVVVVGNTHRAVAGATGDLYPEQNTIHTALRALSVETDDEHSPLRQRVNWNLMGLIGHSFGGVVGLLSFDNVCVPIFCEGAKYQRPVNLRAGFFFGTTNISADGKQIPVHTNGFPIALAVAGRDGMATPDRVRATYNLIGEPRTLIEIPELNHYGITNHNPVAGARPDPNTQELAQNEGLDLLANHIRTFFDRALTP